MPFLKNKRIFWILTILFLLVGLFFYRSFSNDRTNFYQKYNNYPKNTYENTKRLEEFRNIKVKGRVYDVKFRTSRMGNKYTTFKIKTKNGNFYNCFSFGWLPIKNNDILKLSGRYYNIKQVGKYTFYNEIDVKNFEVVN
ncbi:hypothetical protein TDSAC_1722 [Thermodesulfobium acidiphilum]|uniref:OB-fold nucleic acid binding domain-containing protein n=1 Tax=Thermodesulfobium acidiphilum TaxID=1794699 RepID=A0A2R4W2W9_THEAF|nr:hypothetical protein [Thermodesulfobium acidiphilum]AWB11058.1 hypothetical protein TDSAC_1722 [Thermodesulfobium acidiphilum]PMP85038.1 MAG: hypothetical protein C0174_05595 [Thermodesulfobium narugense]